MTRSRSAGQRSGGRYSFDILGLSDLRSRLSRRWQEHRALRALDAMPAGAMKDLGYPALMPGAAETTDACNA